MPAWQIIDDEGAHSFEDLQRRAFLVKASLSEMRVQPNDRVVLIAENGMAFVAGLFGVLAVGATAIPLDPTLPGGAVSELLTWLQPSAVCVAGRRPRELLKSHAATTLVYIDQLEYRGVDIALQEWTRSRGNDEDPAVVLFTSGTAGRSKGIVLSHRAILHNIAAIADYLRPTSTDVFYIAKSMTHSSTITGEILLAIHSGAGIVARDPLTLPTQLFKRIAHHRPTIICIPPALLRFFAASRVDRDLLKSLHTIHVSGSIIDAATATVIAETMTGIRLINGYGLTEAGPRVAQCGFTKAKPRSIGKPIRGVSVEVRRTDGTVCEPYEAGELCVRSTSLMSGYLEAGGIRSATIAEGWLATGDLGYRDADKDLFVTGRKDEMIISGSHNVFPDDVEDVIRQLPAVRDCIVFGVDDDRLGQRVVCAYSTDSVFDDNQSELIQQIRNFCAEKLTSHQIPKNFYRLSRLPSGPGGKKSRRLAREQCLNGKQNA